MSFIPGDRVTVNGLPATIVVYDETVNQLVYESELPGGATNTTYGHISNSDIRAIEYTVTDGQADVGGAPQEAADGEATAETLPVAPAEDENPNPGSEK